MTYILQDNNMVEDFMKIQVLVGRKKIGKSYPHVSRIYALLRMNIKFQKWIIKF